MKKGIVKNKTWILPLFILTLLAVNLVMVSAPAGTNLDITFQNSEFYKFVSPYLVPAGMEGFQGFIIGVVSLFILWVIFLDILKLIPVFSTKTTQLISIGLAIIMVVFQWNVSFAGWLFSIGATLFGWTGTLAVFTTIIFAIILLILLFVGGSKLQKFSKFLLDIRTNRETLESMTKAKQAGGKIRALKTLAEEGTK